VIVISPQKVTWSRSAVSIRERDPRETGGLPSPQGDSAESTIFMRLQASRPSMSSASDLPPNCGSTYGAPAGNAPICRMSLIRSGDTQNSATLPLATRMTPTTTTEIWWPLAGRRFSFLIAGTRSRANAAGRSNGRRRSEQRAHAQPANNLLAIDRASLARCGPSTSDPATAPSNSTMRARAVALGSFTPAAFVHSTKRSANHAR
jgi:hypothetical protein